MLHCHGYHKHSGSTYYADEQKNTGLKSNESISTLSVSYSFLSKFNEDINKITEDEVDLNNKNEKQNSMNVLATYCVIYPFEIIHEMTSRVFSKNINFTIFTKVIIYFLLITKTFIRCFAFVAENLTILKKIAMSSNSIVFKYKIS